jgi:hypothetical protein
MTTTLAVWTPWGAELPSTGFPELGITNDRPYVGFDDTAQETCYFTDAAPQGLPADLTLVVYYVMESATSGAVVFEAAIEAVSSGDATDLDATTSFDTANSSGAVTVPATAGYLQSFTITLSNDDAIVAGDYFRVSLARDPADASDTATGDCRVLAVELRGD